MSQSKTYSRRADAGTAVDPDELSGGITGAPACVAHVLSPAGSCPPLGLEAGELGVDEMTAVIDLVRAGPAIGRDPGPAARAFLGQAAARNL